MSRIKKSKAVKDRENYEVTSDLTSQDVIYTSESSEIQRNQDSDNMWTKVYSTGNDYTTDDTFNSRFFEKYTNTRRSDESNTYDDYTTSAIYYSDRRNKSPQSKSDQIYSGQQSYKRYRNQHSPSRHHDYSGQGNTGGRKRSRRTRSPDKYHDYELDTETEVFKDRRTLSPKEKRTRDYNNHIYPESGEMYSYGKYFENINFEKGSQRIKDKFNDSAATKWEPHLDGMRNEKGNFQALAYQQPDKYDFYQGKKSISKSTLLSPEIEIKTHEYPVLAFKDIGPSTVDKHSEEMIYLPVIVLDNISEQSASKHIPTEEITQNQMKNVHVYAANLQDQQNIFQTLARPTKQSLENVLNTEPASTNKTQKELLSNDKPMISSGMRYADSLLGSIFDKEQFNQKPTKENVSNIIDRKQKDTISYQVNVDIMQSNKGSTLSKGNQSNKGSTLSKGNKIYTTDEIKYQQIQEPLHDEYPVVKDYIKVNDNISEQQGNSMTIPEKQSEEKKISSERKSVGAPSSFKVLTKEKISQSIANSMAVPPTRSIIKKNVTQLSNEEVKSELEIKNTIIGSKQDLMVIPSYVDNNNPDVEVKKIAGSTRISAVQENISPESIKSNRKSTVVEVLQDQSKDKGNKLEPTRSFVQTKQTENPKISRSPSKDSTVLKNQSQDKVEKKTSNSQKSKQDIVRNSTIQKQGTIISQSKPSYKPSNTSNNDNQIPLKTETKLVTSNSKLATVNESPGKIPRGQSLTQQASKIPVPPEQKINNLEQKATTITSQTKLPSSQSKVKQDNHIQKSSENKGKGRDDSQEALTQFTKEVFQVDLAQIEPGKGSFVASKYNEPNENPVGSKHNELNEKPPSAINRKNTIISRVVASKQTELENKEYTKNSESNPNTRKQKSKSKESDLRTQSIIQQNRLNQNDRQTLNAQTGNQPQNDTNLKNAAFSKTQYTSEKERKTSPIYLPYTETKKQSTLMPFERGQSHISNRPYIQVRPEDLSHSLKTGENFKRQEDSYSQFIQSVEPTSTLYKNEKESEKMLRVKSNKIPGNKSKSLLKKRQSRSGTKISPIRKRSKSGTSKTFLKSKGTVNKQDSGNVKSKSKTKIQKNRSMKNLWGILKPSKSKKSKENVPGTVNPYPYEQSLPTYVPTEGPNKREEEQDDKIIENEKKEAKDCDCFSEYIKQFRECVHFVLGTTLHQEVINVLKLF